MITGLPNLRQRSPVHHGSHHAAGNSMPFPVSRPMPPKETETGNVGAFEGVNSSAIQYRSFMNPQAAGVMREALEKISATHQPTSDAADKYDHEEILEKLDFAVIIAREALDRASIPGESQN